MALGVSKAREHVREEKEVLLINHNHDGVDRREFLKCMARAGTAASHR
jgi:hypothetical protein